MFPQALTPRMDAPRSLPTRPIFRREDDLEIADLPASLRAEAEELAAVLAQNPAELQSFIDDLFWRESEISAEDRCAAQLAIELAIAARTTCDHSPAA